MNYSIFASFRHLTTKILTSLDLMPREEHRLRMRAHRTTRQKLREEYNALAMNVFHEHNDMEHKAIELKREAETIQRRTLLLDAKQRDCNISETYLSGLKNSIQVSKTEIAELHNILESKNLNITRLETVFDEKFNTIRQLWLSHSLNKLKHYNAGYCTNEITYECRHQANLERFFEANQVALTTDELEMFKRETGYVENYEPPAISFDPADGWGEARPDEIVTTPCLHVV